MPPTLEDVGRRCGVSRSTVSRVINNSPLVNLETREKVLATIKEMGYAPNFIARSLTTNRTETIAVTLPDITGGVFPEILAGMDEIASFRGYHLLVVFLGGARPDSSTVDDLMRHRRVDVIITVASTVDDKVLEELAESAIPIVRVAKESPMGSIPSVLYDNRGGAKAATKLLLERGCKRPIHIAGPQGNYDADQRALGFKDALQEAGLPFSDDIVIPGTFIRDSGTKAIQTALDKSMTFDGVFAGNDDMAIGALEVICERGITVPEQVAVVGFDDIDVARFIGLSTVHVPMRELGRKAATLAFQFIDKKPVESIVLETQVKERASSQRGTDVRPIEIRRVLD